jgi:hypothetical protein
LGKYACEHPCTVGRPVSFERNQENKDERLERHKAPASRDFFLVAPSKEVSSIAPSKEVISIAPSKEVSSIAAQAPQ